jgi:hypothetical protein
MLKKVRNAAVLMLFLSGVCWGADNASVSPVPALPETTRGQTVTVQGANFPAQGVKIFLRNGTEKPGDKGIPLDATVAGDGKSLSFKLPEDHFETGRYLVYIAFDSTELAVPGDINVLPDQAAKVQIDSIFPATVYRSDQDDGYDFEISGTNLGQAANDNILEVLGDGAQPVGTADECKKYKETGIFEKPCLFYEPGMETRKLSVRGFHPAHYEGPVQFRLRVNGAASEAKQVTFSGITGNGLRVLSTAVSLVLGAFVLALVWKGIGICKIGGESYNPAASFFLDKQTNSYSLSKFQLLAWTGVAVFSYIYVFFCRTLVQWNFTFPAIPTGWPTMLGLSAGTTLTAVGITISRGSKGGGPIKPSMADFISSGGLVLSDRFQFFVWTLVGCAGFLLLVLSQDPSKLLDLPEVPSGFLYLMGISATGYLGGKLVHLPGPVMTQLLVATVVPPDAGGSAGKMTIYVKGQNLSQNAVVKVDDDTLRPDQCSIEALKAQDQAPDPSFCSEINVTLNDASAYLEGEHKLTLTNNDGQMAARSFPADPLTIDPVPALTASDQPTDVQISGKNFGAGMTAEWTNGAGVTTNLAVTPDPNKPDAQLKITLRPGPIGNGKFVLISAINLRASASVIVKAAPQAN